VSCIYGLGSPQAYAKLLVFLERGQRIERDRLLRRLVDIQYERSDYDFHRGTFRVRGDVVEIYPASEEGRALRIEFFGDEIEAICEIDPLRGRLITKIPNVAIYPASHYVTAKEDLERALVGIRAELEERLGALRREAKLLEAQRLEQRTRYDVELLEEMGFCPGIENYSRHIDGRCPGEPPHTLLDYLMTESRGVSMWWPFTDRRYKLQGPNPIDYTWSTTSFWNAAVDIIQISLTELIIFGPLLLIVIWLRNMSSERGIH